MHSRLAGVLKQGRPGRRSSGAEGRPSKVPSFPSLKEQVRATPGVGPPPREPGWPPGSGTCRGCHCLRPRPGPVILGAAARGPGLPVSCDPGRVAEKSGSAGAPAPALSPATCLGGLAPSTLHRGRRGSRRPPPRPPAPQDTDAARCAASRRQNRGPRCPSPLPARHTRPRPENLIEATDSFPATSAAAAASPSAP